MRCSMREPSASLGAFPGILGGAVKDVPTFENVRPTGIEPVPDVLWSGLN